MKVRAYTADHTPFVANVSSYCSNWIEWWTLCQPSWHRNKGWPLPRDNASTTNWAKVCARGQSGLFLLIMSTTWWAASIRSEKDWSEFDEAMDDLHWVICQATDSLKTLSTPALPAPTKTSQQLASGIGWMTHAGGKRQLRPTARLLEGGGI